VLFLEVIVAVAVLFAIGAAVAVRRRELSPAGRDASDTRVPPQSMAMTPTDVDSLRFGLAFRGYRMDQVDDALDRLREELRGRDEQLAALSAETVAARPRPRTWTPPVDDTPPEVTETPVPVEGAPEPEPVTAEPVSEQPLPEPPEEVTELPDESVAEPVEEVEPEPEPEPEPVTEPATAQLPTGPIDEPVQPPEPAPAPRPAAPSTPPGDRISKLRRPRPVPES
jgi:DivIVA domain-containing protein